MKIRLESSPLVFDPIYIEKPWGGSKLTGEKGIGEAFLISDLTGASTRCLGKSVQELFLHYGEEFFGKELTAKHGGNLPIYLKELDAADNLSVQVHPDNKFAKDLENEPFGKNEAWYILEATKGAGLYLGLKEGVSETILRNALAHKDDVSELMNFVPVCAGSFFYLPAGLLHALGKGVRLLEPQQNSNTTYRVWDWNRVDEKGAPRELHIEKALKVINFDSSFNGQYSKAILLKKNLFLDGEYFKVEYFSLRNEEMVLKRKSLLGFIVPIKGSLEVRFDGLENKPVMPGKACLIPAFVHNVVLSTGVSADCLFITPK